MMRMRIWAVRTVQKVNLLEELKRWIMKEKGKGKGKKKKKRRKKKEKKSRVRTSHVHCAVQQGKRRVKNKCNNTT